MGVVPTRLVKSVPASQTSKLNDSFQDLIMLTLSSLVLRGYHIKSTSMTPSRDQPRLFFMVLLALSDFRICQRLRQPLLGGRSGSQLQNLTRVHKILSFASSELV